MIESKIWIYVGPKEHDVPMGQFAIAMKDPPVPAYISDAAITIKITPIMRGGIDIKSTPLDD